MLEALLPDGVVLVNLLSHPDGECGRFFHALFGTYAAVFPRVQAFAVGDLHDRARWQNIILAAFASPEETPPRPAPTRTSQPCWPSGSMPPRLRGFRS